MLKNEQAKQVKQAKINEISDIYLRYYISGKLSIGKKSSKTDEGGWFEIKGGKGNGIKYI